MLFVAPLGARDAPVRDIFIGTIAKEGSNLILERCDVGRTRYVLRAAEGGEQALAVLRQHKGLVQAELVASYRTEGGDHVLYVASVDNVQAGKTCHLTDAIDALAAQAPKDDLPPVAALLEKAAQARSAGGEAGALEAYRQVAAIMEADPAQQNAMSLVLRADLQRDIARATVAAGAGDPCPALDKGQVYLDRARGRLSASEGGEQSEALGYIEQSLAADRRKMRCAPPAASADIGRADAALAGHYYLSGVMETGSELRLRADGRFDWYISYGAVDQVAEGRWGRVGDIVTLATDAPPVDAPLFRADQAFPWNEEAERRLRELERAREEDAIAARCPWGMGVVAAPAVVLPESHPPAGPAEQARAAKAKREAEAARDVATRAVARAVAVGASDADRTAADAAMTAWHSARYEMEQAHRAAQLAEPEMTPPAMPRECQPASEASAADIPPSQWQRGIAVVVGDPARELRLSRVQVTFEYSDGHRETATTGRGGWAFAPMRPQTGIVRLHLAMPEPDSRSASLAIPHMAQGIQTVLVDARQIVARPFEIMRLDVRGGDLVPQDMPRGRYTRN